MKYVIYWTQETYKNDEDEDVVDYSLRAFRSVEESEFAELYDSLKPEQIIHFEGVTFVENVPAKFLVKEKFEDGEEDLPLYESFTKSMQRQWD